MNKKERDHMSAVAEIGCIACLTAFAINTPYVELHHIGNGATGKKSSNFEVIPLCPEHHRLGGYGVAIHAGKKSFQAKYGTEQELLEKTLKLLNV